ncbi:VCBS repeat-containing protein [Thalassococcus sp. CAU 1522]|uniref:VCBS repeat-containing protein n=1 Tax=Thalassococcus arenae TaxID=2851652 RepID=A0ABS6N3K7_9RHOB|nr:VCBS repeat-containing protein [Thalassococcus arenae]MBV2358232.1 VCBS repeat-containing protein [Thalassococcus arenae]
MAKAPRQPARPWRSLARGAGLAACLWLAGQGAAADILRAEYTDPTTRYAHGVLGDAIEYGALELVLDDGTRLRAVLPEDLVFEDIAPRLADLDGDGDAEVVTVEASQTGGGRLAIWDETGRIGATPHIGQPNRWLAPVGAADLDGDGAVEIAYVDRPHLARVLRVWRFEGGALTEVAALEGFSNHRIGWDYIEGGIRECGDGPEMVLASGDWRRVMAVRFDGALSARALGDYSAAAVARALACR